MGQQTGNFMLRLPSLQSRSARQPQELVEKSGSGEHCLPRIPHYRLLHWLLRLQEQQKTQLLLDPYGIGIA